MRLPRTALLALVLVLSAPAAAHALTLFHTPSNNIGCAMSDTGQLGHFVRCDIGEHSWPLPQPRPKGQACRELDYIAGLTIDTKGKSQFFCAGDTVLHQG